MRAITSILTFARCCGLAGAVLGLAAWMPPAVQGYFSQDDTGTTAANFLKIPIGARSSGLAGAFTAVADDVSSLWWNPSGLMAMTSRETLLETQFLNREFMYHTLAHQEVLDAQNRLGFMVNYLTPDIPLAGFDNAGNAIGDIAYSEIAFAATFATGLFEVPFGITVKGISSQLYTESALGFALDIGLQEGFFRDDLMVGLSVKNLGPKLAYLQEAYPLPSSVALGAAYRLLNRDLTLSAEIQAPFDQKPHVHGGVELVRNLGLPFSFALRAGYHSNWQGYANSINGLAAGLGVEWRLHQRVLTRVGRMVGYREQQTFLLGLDYAWTPNDQLDDSHHLTVRFSF